MSVRNPHRCPLKLWRSLSEVGKLVYNECYDAMVYCDAFTVDKDLWQVVQHNAGYSAAKSVEKVLKRTS